MKGRSAVMCDISSRDQLQYCMSVESQPSTAVGWNEQGRARGLDWILAAYKEHLSTLKLNDQSTEQDCETKPQHATLVTFYSKLHIYSSHIPHTTGRSTSRVSFMYPLAPFIIAIAIAIIFNIAKTRPLLPPFPSLPPTYYHCV